MRRSMQIENQLHHVELLLSQSRRNDHTKAMRVGGECIRHLAAQWCGFRLANCPSDVESGTKNRTRMQLPGFAQKGTTQSTCAELFNQDDLDARVDFQEPGEAANGASKPEQPSGLFNHGAACCNRPTLIQN